jgi:hypothetical protein
MMLSRTTTSPRWAAASARSWPTNTAAASPGATEPRSAWSTVTPSMPSSLSTFSMFMWTMKLLPSPVLHTARNFVIAALLP